jgi:hypothetical protein
LGQDGNTGGIWNRVELVITDPTHIDRIQISPLLLSDGTARLNISVTLYSTSVQEVDLPADSVTALGDALRPAWQWRVPKGSKEGEYHAEGELISDQGEILSRNRISFHAYFAPGASRRY